MLMQSQQQGAAAVVELYCWAAVEGQVCSCVFASSVALVHACAYFV
jgi:hypothetical protein